MPSGEIGGASAPAGCLGRPGTGEPPGPAAAAHTPGSRCVGTGPRHLGDARTSESELEAAVSYSQCPLFTDSAVHLLAGIGDTPQTNP